MQLFWFIHISQRAQLQSSIFSKACTSPLLSSSFSPQADGRESSQSRWSCTWRLRAPLPFLVQAWQRSPFCCPALLFALSHRSVRCFGTMLRYPGSEHRTSQQLLATVPGRARNTQEEKRSPVPICSHIGWQIFPDGQDLKRSSSPTTRVLTYYCFSWAAPPNGGIKSVLWFIIKLVFQSFFQGVLEMWYFTPQNGLQWKKSKHFVSRSVKMDKTDISGTIYHENFLRNWPGFLHRFQFWIKITFSAQNTNQQHFNEKIPYQSYLYLVLSKSVFS